MTRFKNVRILRHLHFLHKTHKDHQIHHSVCFSEASTSTTIHQQQQQAESAVMTANATELETRLLERRMGGGARHPPSRSIDFNLNNISTLRPRLALFHFSIKK